MVTTASSFDLSAVTSAEISVVAPSGAMLSWSWSVQAVSASACRLVHVFSEDGTDAQEVGNYTIKGWVVTPVTRRRIKKITLAFARY